MKKFAKIASIFLLSAVLLGGCTLFQKKTTSEKYHYSPDSSQVQSGFNEEVYVWESLNFSTNRVKAAK